MVFISAPGADSNRVAKGISLHGDGVQVICWHLLSLHTWYPGDSAIPVIHSLQSITSRSGMYMTPQVHKKGKQKCY